MKSRGPLFLIFLFAIVIAVEGSILLKNSLLRPSKADTCFTCKAGERPFAYPLIAQLGKFKDLFVKVFKSIVASAKEYTGKLESKI